MWATALAACGQASPPSVRVLFIGNSYTYSNQGIDQELEGLAPDLQAESIAKSGYSLEDHWNDGEAVSKIRDETWDYVVLQEQSQRPVLAYSSFLAYAQALDQIVRESNSHTILMMTWERPDSVGAGVTTTNLAIAYNQVADQLGARVAPVGLSFARLRIERPDLILYSADGHPTSEGTYLAACVIYGVISGETPLGNPYLGSGIPFSDATYLQQVAAETLGY